MMNILKKLLIFSVLTAFIALPSRAAFMDYGFGARGAGKGGAFLASADDASGAEWNPASLVNVNGISAMFEYNEHFAGLPGVSLNHVYASVVYGSDSDISGGLSYTGFKGNDLYRSGAWRLSLAADKLELSGMRVITGLSLKYLTHSYDYDRGTEEDREDPIVNKGDSAGAFTADLGLIFKPAVNIHAGITLKNIIPADVGIDGEDVVPFEAGLGVGCILMPNWYFKEIMPEVLVYYRDQQCGKDRDKINLGLGLEAWNAGRQFGLRTGINKYESALGGSFAFDIGSDAVRLDYTAILPFTELSDYFIGHHRISLSYSFGSLYREQTGEEKAEKMRKNFMEGYRLFKDGEYRRSIIYFGKVLEIDPDHESSKNYIERAWEKFQKFR